ncbi:MAG TPA: ribosomal protein S18-alanine N-acetyltransferase [Candidatus Deferrimicrobiaceae bacterium]
MRVKVRDMAEEDLDAVMAIERECFPTPWSRGMFSEELGREYSDAMVALPAEGGGVAGYAVCWTIAGESHLLNIAVAPAYRGRSVACRLLAECIRRGARGGADRIHLEVRAGNDDAIRLYRGHGFEFMGMRKGYYTDTGEDAILLSREIRESDAK